MNKNNQFVKKDRESVKDFIKSNKIGLAQSIIENYKNIKNVK